MQTLLPQLGYAESTRRLTPDVLKVQIKDAWDILEKLQSRPATVPLSVLMWRRYERRLCIYGLNACGAWQIGLGNNTGLAFTKAFSDMDAYLKDQGETAAPPPWNDDIDIRRSHRSNLIRRFPNSNYAEQWPKTPERMPYLYGIPLGEDDYVLRVSYADAEKLESGARKLPDNLYEYDPNTREVYPR